MPSTPAWPYRMPVHLAAAFCGFVDAEGRPQIDAFRRRVAEGLLPQGRPDGKRHFWFRYELEQALDRLAEADGAVPSGDPYVNAL